MATLASFASEERRPSGRVVSALASHVGGPGFEPRCQPFFQASFYLFIYLFTTFYCFECDTQNNEREAKLRVLLFCVTHEKQ